MAKITLKHLAHSYDGQHYALAQLDHTWQHGGAYALLGPSGCGKSTLLNIISGLLEPSEGEVLFDDQAVTRLSPQQRNIAQVFQFPVVYDAMTVRENLAFPLKNMKLSAQHIDSKVSEIADLLELQDCLDQKAKNLSADLKQKISMGRGLVREDVSAILFDEPLTVIDPHLKWKLRRKLKEIHEKLNVTMIYVTHDQLEAATFADEIAVLYEGQIVQFGTPQELFERPNHTFVGYFIGSPGMNFASPIARDNRLFLNDHEIKLSELQRQEVLTNRSSNIKIGIRPEFVQVSQVASEHSYPVTLQDIEQLGTHQLLTVDFAGAKWRAKVDAHQQFGDESVHITLPPEALKLYIDEFLCGEVNEH